MSKIKTFPMEGIKVFELNRIVDERGSFTEIMRNDWTELFGDGKIQQSNLSINYPGMIRAWHRHARGQIDYYVVVKGTVKICVYDNDKNSKTLGNLTEIISSDQKLQVVRVPGHYWHGIKTLGNEASMLVYFINGSPGHLPCRLWSIAGANRRIPPGRRPPIPPRGGTAPAPSIPGLARTG